MPSLALAAALIAVIGYAVRLLFRRLKRDVTPAVVTLIAGISLYDALIIASTGATGPAGLAVLGFALTLLLQRVAPGT